MYHSRIPPILALALVFSLVRADPINVPNTFQAGETARASEVNENFSELENESNAQDTRINSIEDALLVRTYGDGSQGDLDVPTDQISLPGNTRQFQNCIVRAGTTLTVDSGTVVRCRGTFTNEGTIEVKTYASGANLSGGGNDEHRPPSAGQAPSVAGIPDYNAAFRGGAPGTTGIAVAGPRTATNLLQPGPVGGGGGSGPLGGDGGGTLTILAHGAISNTGSIVADGETPSSAGSGGGGGGIVILASADSIVNSGTISVRGGDGSSGNVGSPPRVGPGGGGGGGFVHLISPAMIEGTIDRVGGTGATGGQMLSAAENDLLVLGGGAGGACWGGGGSGGDIDATGLLTDAFDGTNGTFFKTLADPAAFF